MKLSNIKPNPKNPRIIKDEKFKKLVKSIKDFPEMMDKRPMVCVTDVDKKIYPLGGNMRLKAIQELGHKEIPDTWVMLADSWTQEQRNEFTIKDNVGFGEWDWDSLANEWDVEKLDEWGLDVPGFEPEVLEAEEDDFAVPDGGVETDIVLGDLFEIGEHRLLCGDSTDSDQVAKLMNGKNILNISVLTDPPYGIKWNGDYTRFKKNGIADSKTKYEDIKNDDVEFNPSQFYEYEDVIIWGANIFSNKLDRGSWLIWDKRSNDGTSFLADAEIAWQKGDKYGCYIKSINQQSEKSKTRDIKHPTKKPIELMIWCIERLKENNIIFDAYLGSGSTMVAAHQLKRKCYGMELDPKYCQVIVDRMIKLDPTLVIKKNGVTMI
jgi:DNA modification methylase